jgi:hypothetical protein
MANRMYRPLVGSLTPGVVALTGSFTIGASGAVASSSCLGFSVAKTASETGRYTITLQDTYNAFLGCQVTVEVAADTAIGATTGFISTVRNVSVADSTPAFDIQLSDAAGADANPASGYIVYVVVLLKNSSVTR